MGGGLLHLILLHYKFEYSYLFFFNPFDFFFVPDIIEIYTSLAKMSSHQSSLYDLPCTLQVPKFNIFFLFPFIIPIHAWDVFMIFSVVLFM
jgi:hypothetical protein